jgi:flagellar hook protein FlgE
MIGSLFTAITGLQAFQQELNVEANNIANANTVGYKAEQSTFETLVSQILRGAAAPTATNGGSAPKQLGLGVQVANIAPVFTQGSAQTTGNPTDLMIQGNGLFVLNENGAQVFSRAGAFARDGNGNLVEPATGAMVMGFPAQGTPPATNVNAPIVPMNIPSTYASFNIGSDGTITGINSAGNPTILGQIAIVTFPNPSGLQMGANSFYTPTLDSGVANLNAATVPTFSGVSAATATAIPASTAASAIVPSLAVPAGVVTLPGNISVFGTYTGAAPVTSLQISFDTTAAGLATNGKVSLNGAAFTGVGVTTTAGPPGTLVYAGLTITLPTALNAADQISKTGYTINLGTSGGVTGTPGTNGLGTIIPGAREMSNVDLSREFSDMIVAERGFEANSKVITTADSVLTTLVNMKSQA